MEKTAELKMGKYTGQPYRPSNGSEGDFFMEEYCMRCFHERYLHTMKDNSKKCEILSGMMIYDTADPEYPKELVYDENDNPVCTKWKKWDWDNDGDGRPKSPRRPKDVPDNQMILPFIIEEVRENTMEEPTKVILQSV